MINIAKSGGRFEWWLVQVLSMVVLVEYVMIVTGWVESAWESGGVFVTLANFWKPLVVFPLGSAAIGLPEIYLRK
jgi:hypothetical protein